MSTTLTRLERRRACRSSRCKVRMASFPNRSFGVPFMAQKRGGSGQGWHGHFEPGGVPAGVWMRCDGCGATLFRKEVERNFNVCPQCDHHFSVPAAERIAQLLDADTFEEWYADLCPGDPLEFNDRRPYPERIASEQARTGLNEAAV